MQPHSIGFYHGSEYSTKVVEIFYFLWMNMPNRIWKYTFILIKSFRKSFRTKGVKKVSSFILLFYSKLVRFDLWQNAVLSPYLVETRSTLLSVNRIQIFVYRLVWYILSRGAALMKEKLIFFSPWLKQTRSENYVCLCVYASRDEWHCGTKWKWFGLKVYNNVHGRTLRMADAFDST